MREKSWREIPLGGIIEDAGNELSAHKKSQEEKWGEWDDQEQHEPQSWALLRMLGTLLVSFSLVHFLYGSNCACITTILIC